MTARQDQPSLGPFENPFLNQLSAALKVGDEAQFDRVSAELMHSAEGQRFTELGEQLFRQEQADQAQVAHAQQQETALAR